MHKWEQFCPYINEIKNYNIDKKLSKGPVPLGYIPTVSALSLPEFRQWRGIYHYAKNIYSAFTDFYILNKINNPSMLRTTNLTQEEINLTRCLFPTDEPELLKFYFFHVVTFLPQNHHMTQREAIDYVSKNI